MYKAINGEGFLTSLSQGWQDKIVKTSWLYGDMGMYTDGGYDPGSALKTYEIESGQAEAWSGSGSSGFKFGRWTESITAKVGLMYVSDLMYSPNGRDESNCYSYKCKDSSWMMERINIDYWYEWTMTRGGRNNVGQYYAYWCQWQGYMENTGYDSPTAVRPVFFIDTNQGGSGIIGGDGSSSNPFIVECGDVTCEGAETKPMT